MSIIGIFHFLLAKNHNIHCFVLVTVFSFSLSYIKNYHKIFHIGSGATAYLICQNPLILYFIHSEILLWWYRTNTEEGILISEEVVLLGVKSLQCKMECFYLTIKLASNSIEHYNSLNIKNNMVLSMKIRLCLSI